MRRKTGAEPTVTSISQGSDRRAPPVRASHEAALSVLVELEGEIAQLALEAIERQPGAAEKLVAQREKIDAARRAADELRAALELAERLDRETDAVGAATLRAEQLAIFERAGAERVQAMTEIIQCVATSTEAFGRYVAASRRMVGAVPTGTHLPLMAFGNGDGGNWLGDGELLIGREAYRLAELAGTPKLFFARPPALSQGTSAERMQPAADVLEETQAAVLRELVGQVARLNREDLQAAGVAVPPLEIVEVPAEPLPPPLRSRQRETEAPSAAPAQPPFEAFAMTDAEAIAGITPVDCAGACGAQGCALTGGARCAHPMKGGLTMAEQGRREVLARYTAACKLAGAANIHEVQS